MPYRRFYFAIFRCIDLRLLKPMTQSFVPSVASSDDHLITSLPILVLFPHNRCNCRCVMCDIWRIRQTREITPGDLQRQLESLRALGVRWVVLSGGEPLMHSEFGALCRLLRAADVRITILTTGLLLKTYAAAVVEYAGDVIVSLDGPAELHDQIRNIPRAFERLNVGVQALRNLRPDFPVSARCTVQKTNFHALRATVRAARRLGLNSISFLAADVTSQAFNRPGGWGPERQQAVALDNQQVDRLATEVEGLISDCTGDIASGFIVESPHKLRRIVQHFRAQLGQVPFVAPPCNAPWVSAVVEADGTVRPCFFHAPLGNLHEEPLLHILNSHEAVAFRRSLDVSTHLVCRRCVCSLHLEHPGNLSEPAGWPTQAAIESHSQ